MKNAVIRAKEARTNYPYLTTKQTAFHLGIAVCTLHRLRYVGGGPIGRPHGRGFHYHIDDIEAWSVAHEIGCRHD